MAKTRTVVRSAVDGQFKPSIEAIRNPDTTVKERIKISAPKPHKPKKKP